MACFLDDDKRKDDDQRKLYRRNLTILVSITGQFSLQQIPDQFTGTESTPGPSLLAYCLTFFFFFSSVHRA